MASITVRVPDDLASQVRAGTATAGNPGVGTPGTACSRQSGFDGAADVLELLAALPAPAPEEILELRPSPRLAARVSDLIEKSRAGTMTQSDREDWEKYEYLEHLVRMAKAAAHVKLTQFSRNG